MLVRIRTGMPVAFPETGSEVHYPVERALLLTIRKGRIAVECTGLENRRAGNGSVGSNPTPSARSYQLLCERERYGINMFGTGFF